MTWPKRKRNGQGDARIKKPQGEGIVENVDKIYGQNNKTFTHYSKPCTRDKIFQVVERQFHHDKTRINFWQVIMVCPHKVEPHEEA